MIVKITTDNNKESYIISGVKGITRKFVDRNSEEALDTEPMFTISELNDVISKNVWCLIIDREHGDSEMVLADLTSVYVMNDDGKTIDHF